MTGIQIFIGGVEVVSDKTFVITEELLTTASTILNNLMPKTWDDNKDYYSNFYFPKDYSGCEIYNNGELIFAGIVKNSGDISLRPTDPKYCSLQVLDYKTLLSEGKTLDFVISNKTIIEAITQVTNAIADYGFVVGNIEINNGTELIGAYNTLNKTPYDVYQYLAEISQTRWFTRMIDADTVAVDFYSPELMTRANDIEYTAEYFETNNIIDISFSFTTQDYRNQQAIISKMIYANIDTDETITATSNQNVFTTSQTIGILNYAYVNGVAKTIGTNIDKNLGIYADFYYTPEKNTIEASINYTLGDQVRFIYTPLIQGREVVSNNDEIDRIETQTGRNGIISRYEERNDILSSIELNKIAQTYIQYKGKSEIILSVKTQNTDILQIGQQVYFDIPVFTELALDYLVTKKEIGITKTGTDGVTFYTYTLSSNYNSETAINYFDNQRRKASGNIGNNEFIIRNIDVNTQTDIIFDNLIISDISATNDNILNSILNSPFID